MTNLILEVLGRKTDFFSGKQKSGTTQDRGNDIAKPMKLNVPE